MKKDFSPKRILVAVDLSRPSEAALAAAKTLAKRHGARLEVLTIQSAPESLLGLAPESEPYSGEELTRQLEEFRLWREDKIRGMLNGSGGRAAVRTLRGWPPGVLARFAAPRRADLLVMGTHGYAGLEHAAFGSVAEAVVRRSRIPVLIVHAGKARRQVRRVLVPCNLQPYADEALRDAIAFAAAAKASVGVLLVAATGQWPLDAELVLRKHLEKLLGRRQAAHLKVVVRCGDPRHEILAEAKEGRWDLIALSAHRRSFWSELVLGSTAERVLRHSPVPVLAFPSQSKGAARAAPRSSRGIRIF